MIDTIKANERLEKIRELREIKEDLKKQRKTEEEKIKLRFETEIEKLETQEKEILDLITGELEVAEEKKVVCLNGTVSKRKVPAKYEYSDDLLKELKEKGYGQYIRTTEEVDKVTLKSEVIVKDDGSCYTEAGEKLDGVRVTDGGYTWTVKING